MAAAPDDDARGTLAELEAKLRELEHELLRGHEPVTRSEPLAAAPPPAPDVDALSEAHDLLTNLRATVASVGATAERVSMEARAVIEDHGRTLGRMERAAEAAGRAEQAAAEAGRHAATVVVEAGPFADADAVVSFRDALAAQPGARDAYVRGVEAGRAVIEVDLAAQ